MTRLEERIDFDAETGLVPAVVQSAEDDRVLMVAYMDDRALRRTLDEGRVTFWSRSRRGLWEKGETSGHWLETVEVRADCDADALLVRARPHGPACHTGRTSCFDAGPGARPGQEAGDPGSPPGEEDGRTAVADAPGDDPPVPDAPGRGPGAGGREADADDLSSAEPSPAPVLASVLEEVVRVVADRDAGRPEGSRTAELLDAGTPSVARKVGEEALEVMLAALREPDRLRRTAEESADLLYHLAVLWRSVGLDPDGVGRVLADRRGGEAG